MHILSAIWLKIEKQVIKLEWDWTSNIEKSTLTRKSKKSFTLIYSPSFENFQPSIY